jgi:hypothetical protein
MAFKCKTKGCKESLPWHLEHGELDCLGRPGNRRAIAAYARAAEALKVTAEALLARSDLQPYADAAAALAEYDAAR